MLPLLLMASLWPIKFQGAADALRWAYCISRCHCQWLHFGPLDFWRVLLMHSDGLIALADAAANGFALAHYFSWRHCLLHAIEPWDDHELATPVAESDTLSLHVCTLLFDLEFLFHTTYTAWRADV